jgi:hypothetical protein
MFLCFENYPWKPPTPGLLLVNRQIYSEAVELLYSKNTFSFKAPQELLDFEHRIAPSHLDTIRRIRIWVIFPFTEGEEVSPDRLPLEKYGEYPLHWAKALRVSRFDRLQKISIAGQCPNALDRELMPRPTPLREAIEDLFSRKQDKDFIPELVLTGFQPTQNLKFPESWNIKSEQWDGVESEGLKDEIQEGKYTNWDAIEKVLGEGGNEEEFEQAADWPVEGE